MVHRRAPPSISLPINKLIVPFEFQTDPLHQKKIMRSMMGQAPVALTRLPLNWITEGYYVRRGKDSVWISEPGFQLGRAAIASRIRGGYRPEIEVYWSPLSPKKHKYVSPDAEAIVLAYRDVGVKMVPARILDCQASKLKESAVLIYETGEREGFVKSIAVPRKNYTSLVRPSDLSPMANVERLISACLQMEGAITAFHQPCGDISYHETILTQVRRHRKILESIRLLLEHGRSDHSLALVRLLYEGFLNHYIDWLSPEFFGPRLHAVSEFRRIQAEDRRKGRSCTDAKVRTALKGLLPLLETVEQKARLSPLGDLFYRIAYPSLSFIVHQDYGEKAADMEGVRTPLERDEVVASWTDAITGALFHTIDGDIPGLS